MNDNAGVMQLTLYILFQMVAHPVRFLHADIPGHNQMQVNVTLSSRLPGAQFVIINQLANVLHNG